MLRSLRVRDLATVADVTLELGSGLNVLTGETGAGKSMLVDALALLLGDRADRAAVRRGAARAVLEAVFDSNVPGLAETLDGAGLDAGEEIVIRREVAAEGRSRAWVNGSPTTLAVLTSIGALLVDLHGQHQTIELERADEQRRLLDSFAGNQDALDAVGAAHRKASIARSDVAALATRRDEAIRRAEWLRHLVDEISNAKVRLGEDEQLGRDINRLAQAGTLGEQAREILELLDDDSDGVRSQLSKIGKRIEALSRLDPETGAWRELLDGAWTQLDELSRLAAGYLDTVAEEPDRLDRLERRLDKLEDLKRRYGGSLEQVLEALGEATAELDLIDTAELDLRRLQQAADAAGAALIRVASELTARRAAAAERLAGEVSRMLPGLALMDASFDVELRTLAAVGPEGAESVLFTASLNKGLESRPIAGAASGGELSRLMLALKVAVARHDATPTLVFDEIDQGIGGETGLAVASALAQVASRHQVLVITHLPQIAARGDRHLRVSKVARGGVATSDVSVLHGDDRVIELARMLGSADDAHARRLALSLMNAGVSG